MIPFLEKIAELEEENARLKAELAQAKKSNDTLSEMCRDTVKSLNDCEAEEDALEAKVAALSQQLASARAAIQTELKWWRDLNRFADNSEAYMKTIARLEKALSSSSPDIAIEPNAESTKDKAD